MPERLPAWIQASRLPSQAYLFLPLLLGQVLAWRVTGEWSWTLFVLVQLFGVFDQLYIVYANDLADETTDRDNATATLFSGGSRVLVEGRLTRAALGRGAWATAALATACGIAVTVLIGHPLPALLAMLGIGLLWAYSFPPLRLSYRGGGEWLQTLGLAAILPLFAYTAQAGHPAGFPWIILATLIPLNLATAVATALPDTPSDQRAGKRTLVVTHGIGPARRFILVLSAGALTLHGTLVHAALVPGVPLWWVLGVPVSSILIAAVIHRRADPGTRMLDAFLFLVILANLAYVAAMVYASVQ